MTRALVWKEVREQRAVWLALALAAAGGVAGVYAVMAPGRGRDEMLTGLLWLAAWGYGLVCGCLLLAGETEDGTQTFLDTLPATRRRLWAVKARAGLALLAAQLSALAAVGLLFLRPGQSPSLSLPLLVGLPLAGGAGYGLGLFCGSLARSVIAAVGWGVLLQLLTPYALFIPVGLATLAIHRDSVVARFIDFNVIQLACLLAPGFAAVTWSRRIYGRADGRRSADPGPAGRGTVRVSWAALFWLAWRQTRWFALGMALFGLLASLAVALVGLAAWPVVSLLAGVFCGVTAFADEQEQGAFRFPGDQRFPLGRFWLVKAGARLAAGLGFTAAGVLGVVAAVAVKSAVSSRQEMQAFESQFQGGRLLGFFAQPWQSLTVWLIYGFSVGLPAGVLFHKPLVAGVVALGVAGPLAAVWLPSLAGGGLHAWQVWGVPAVLVIASRLLMRPWSAGRIVSARTAGVTAGAGLATVLWFAAAVAYRALEVPATPDALDPVALAASLPKPEHNVAGRLTAVALRRLAEIERSFVDQEPDSRPPQRLTLQGQPLPVRQPPPVSFFQRAADVAARGWSGDDPKLAEWLALLFGDSWAAKLAEAADHPTGVTVDPRDANLFVFPPEAPAARTAANLLVARGLERQAHGDPAAFVGHLRTGLALSRNLRHHTTRLPANAGRSVEATLLRGLEHWLENLDGRPDVLRQALGVLAEHEREPQTDPEEVRRAAFLAARNAFEDPANFLRQNERSTFLFPSPGLEADLLRFAWQVPWEKVRLRRLLDELASRDPERAKHAAEHSPYMAFALLPFLAQGTSPDAFAPARPLSRERAALLQVALRLYQAENGRTAESLADLVPRYLAAVPVDPYDGRPFRYRLSRGETLDWPPEDLAAGVDKAAPVRRVPVGWGILWCVGEDGRDDGGHTQQSPQGPGAVAHEDVIFLVPPPPPAGR